MKLMTVVAAATLLGMGSGATFASEAGAIHTVQCASIKIDEIPQGDEGIKVCTAVDSAWNEYIGTQAFSPRMRVGPMKFEKVIHSEEGDSYYVLITKDVTLTLSEDTGDAREGIVRIGDRLYGPEEGVVFKDVPRD